MRKTTSLLAACLVPLLLTACLGLPGEQNGDAPEVPATTIVTDMDESVENGTESPVASVETNPGETVEESAETSETLAGCPEIPDAAAALETPIPDASAAQLVGLAEKVAVTCAEGEGWNVRVVAKDGEEFMVTADYRADRVNLTIVNDVVTAVNVG